ncbi:MAG: hypothetical protein L0210_14655 [Rhodospirillales bacterium]|nr:hypothetical protein [Rhodospirillales bacterium]
MLEWSRFELKAHTFIAYLPSDGKEESVFTVAVLKDSAEIRREKIELFHRPIFGPDVDDVARLNEKVEEIIADLGLE